MSWTSVKQPVICIISHLEIEVNMSDDIQKAVEQAIHDIATHNDLYEKALAYPKLPAHLKLKIIRERKYINLRKELFSKGILREDLAQKFAVIKFFGI